MSDVSRCMRHPIPRIRQCHVNAYMVASQLKSMGQTARRNRSVLASSLLSQYANIISKHNTKVNIVESSSLCAIDTIPTLRFTIIHLLYAIGGDYKVENALRSNTTHQSRGARCVENLRSGQHRRYQVQYETQLQRKVDRRCLCRRLHNSVGEAIHGS
jgi:hypothetical protein